MLNPERRNTDSVIKPNREDGSKSKNGLLFADRRK
jgi:hypothetical protein